MCITQNQEHRLLPTDRPALRLVIYTPSYFKHDGVSHTLRQLVEHMDRTGAEYMIITTRAGMGADSSAVPGFQNCVFEVGIPVVMDPEGVYEEPVGISNEVGSQIVSFRPDLMHVTSPGLGTFSALRWCRTNNVATVATYHSSFDDYALHWLPDILPIRIQHIVMYAVDIYFRTIYNSISTVFVPTPYIQQKLATNGSVQGRVNQSKVWGRAVNADTFHPRRRTALFRERHCIPTAAVIVLWAGRLVPEKGLSLWLEVLARLQQLPGLQVVGVACGKGPAAAQMKHLPHIRDLGWLSTDELSEAYASADVFLFPSAVETFGNVTLEAKASGLPCVVECGCGSHLIQHGANGFCCVAADTDSFFNATAQLVRDPKLRRRFGAQCRADVEKHNNLAAHNQQMLSNYKEVIEAKSVHRVRAHTLCFGYFFEGMAICMGHILHFCQLLGAHRDSVPMKAAFASWVGLVILLLPLVLIVIALVSLLGSLYKHTKHHTSRLFLSPNS